MTKRDHILFIGIGDWDIPQINISKERGLKTIATNRDPKNEALSKCDIPIVIDGRDTYGIISYLFDQELDENILFVYTGTELFLSAAIVAQALGIDWHSPKAAYYCEHKGLMRAKFQEHGIPHPSGGKVDSLDILSDELEKSKLILKPVDSLSSQGVSIVEKKADLAKAFNHATKHSTKKKVIFEQYIEGTLHDVNGILIDEGFVRLGTSDKKAGPLPYAIVMECTCPSSLSTSEQEYVYKLFEKACRAVGLSHGQVKGDLIRDKNGQFMVMEVAPRLHGPLVSLHIIPNALGISPFNELLNYMLGEDIKQHQISKENVGYSKAFACESEDELTDCENNITLLKKHGIKDRGLWKSNNDIPIYAISRN